MAAANEKAKVACSRRDLRARVKCARAVMNTVWPFKRPGWRDVPSWKDKKPHILKPSMEMWLLCLSNVPRSIKNTWRTCGNWKHTL